MAAMLAVIALSRVPLLGGGYGSDDDSWRNVVAALRMRALGHYVPSRPPGFPVFESLLALLAPFGWLATNGATAVAGMVAALLFHRVATRLGVTAPDWLSLGFAFCGGFWITTSQAMDYAYGLSFMLAAYLALLNRRNLAAGILLALGAGCRVTLAGQLLGATALLLTRRSPARAWVSLLAGFAVTFALVFLPVVRSPELGDVRAQTSYHVSHAHLTLRTFVPATRAAMVFLFGRFGLIVIALAGAAMIIARLRPRMPGAIGRVVAGFEGGPVTYELIGIAVSAGLFVVIPYENAYLLPALPFALLLAARVLRPAWIVALVVVFAVEPLVTVSLDTRQLVPGRLLLERATRRADITETHLLASLRPPTPTIYVVGRFRVHRLLLLEPSLERLEPAWKPFEGPGVALWRRDHQVGYAQRLTDVQRDSLASAGYRAVVWPTAERDAH